MRKHPKQSLSQPTIPEEGPEEEMEAITSTPVTSVLKPKPESRVVKNLAQELGAFSKDVASSLKKSNSFKEEKSSSSSMESIEAAKSPKLSRTSPLARGQFKRSQKWFEARPGLIRGRKRPVRPVWVRKGALRRRNWAVKKNGTFTNRLETVNRSWNN